MKKIFGVFCSLILGGLIVLYMAFALVTLVLTTKILRKEETAILTLLGHGFGRFIMFISRSKVEVDGLLNLESIPKGRRIFIVSNHESYLDIPSLLSFLPFPVGFIAKSELGKVPLLGFWIKKCGGILFNRNDMRSAKETLTNVINLQPLDRAILIFPEGTRNKEGKVAPFKPGSIRMAVDSDAIIIPIAQSGGRKKLEGNGWVVKKGVIKIKIMPIVDSRIGEGQLKNHFSESLRSQIVQSYQELS